MEVFKIAPFDIIGISIRTDNSNVNKLREDMQSLWGRFINENVMAQIANKTDHNIYCIYSDYEGDHTKPYQAWLGCKVANLDEIPPGLSGKRLAGGSYHKYVAKGNLLRGCVFEQWQQIWMRKEPRAYLADFEVYGDKSQNPEDAEVDIFVGY